MSNILIAFSVVVIIINVIAACGNYAHGNYKSSMISSFVAGFAFGILISNL